MRMNFGTGLRIGAVVVGAAFLAACDRNKADTPADVLHSPPAAPAPAPPHTDVPNNNTGSGESTPTPNAPDNNPRSENIMPHGPLQVGAAAPTFKLESNNGKTVDLANFEGKQVIVLYFYPKAGTPGCTKEACAFRDAIASYQEENIAVLGISPDPVHAIDKFTSDFHLNFPLLADTDHKVAEEYGVWQEKMGKDGQMRWGAARTTFVIGKDGKLIHVFEKVNPEGHDQVVLQWLKDNRVKS
jgi:peroxiredoxin Q/BCP